MLSVQLVILFLGKVLGFAEVHPNHPQPSKTAEVCLVQTKMKFISHCEFELTNIGVNKKF